MLFSWKLCVLLLICVKFIAASLMDYEAQRDAPDFASTNFLWGGALLLAWSELQNSVIGDTLFLKTTEQDVLQLVDQLNQDSFSSLDLHPGDFYVRAGVGQHAIDRINEELKVLHPLHRSPFQGITDVPSSNLVGFSWIQKKILFPIAFSQSEKIEFKDSRVKGFFAANPAQKSNVRVYAYKNDDNFVISILTEDPTLNLFLVKTQETTLKPSDISSYLALQNSSDPLSPSDSFSMPNIHLEKFNSYKQLQGLRFTDPALSGFFMGRISQKISLDISSKGVIIDNQASLVSNSLRRQYQPRKLHLNKSFWVVMKYENKNPFLVAHITKIV